jgi:hypothetical protein
VIGTAAAAGGPAGSARCNGWKAVAGEHLRNLRESRANAEHAGLLLPALREMWVRDHFLTDPDDGGKQ